MHPDAARSAPVRPSPAGAFSRGAILRVLVTVVLLGLVFRGVALEEVAQAVRRADGWLVLAGFLMNWSGVALSAARWQLLLRAQGGDASHGALARSFMVGQFFNNLLPSTIGGDAVRAYDSWRFGATKGAAVTLVVVDRLLGLGALAIFALVSATLLTRPAISTPLLAAALLAAAAVAGLSAWIIFAPPAAVVALLDRLPVSLRRRIQVLARQAGDGLMRFHGNPWVLGKAFAISVLIQIGAITFYALLGAALGFQVPAWHWFLIVPIAVLAMLAPLSVNAIGVREGVFAFLLASYAVTTAEAVAFAWLAYTSVALQAMLGGALYLARARRGDRPRRLSGSMPVPAEPGDAEWAAAAQAAASADMGVLAER